MCLLLAGWCLLVVLHVCYCVQPVACVLPVQIRSIYDVWCVHIVVAAAKSSRILSSQAAVA